MADNLTLNAGTGGATLKTDELADLSHVQYVKLLDGTANGTGVIAGDATNGLDVDVTRLPALPAGTNNIGDVDILSIAAGDNNIGNVDIVTLPALPAGTNNIGDVDIVTMPNVTIGAMAALVAGTANIGDVDVLTLPALPAGTNNIGDVDVLTLPALATGTNSIGRVNPEPQTANGLSISRVLSAATTNATSVKGSAGQVYTIIATNINAAVRYLKIYNKATAPTVGTDTPVITLPIPGNTAGAGLVLDTGGMGITFSLGIATALTTGIADADTAAVAANEIVVNIFYK